MTSKTKTRRKYRPLPEVVPPTPEQLASGNIIHNNKRYMAVTQVPLDFYKNMKPGGINQTQWEAGNLLFEIFSKTGITVPTVASYSPQSLGAQGDSVTEKQILARERYRKALKSVNGAVGQAMVENVCSYGYLLKEIPVAGYSQGSDRMARFREALNDLVKHFHIPITARDRKYFYGELGWD